MTEKLDKSGFKMFAVAPLFGLLFVAIGSGSIRQMVSLFYLFGGVVPFYLFILLAWLMLKPKTTQQLNLIVLFSPLGTAAIYIVLLLPLGLVNLSAAILFTVPIGYVFVFLYFLFWRHPRA
jgi:hypothetical protein